MSFKLLSRKEEKALSNEERLKYFDEVQKYYASLKMNGFARKLRTMIHPLLVRIMETTLNCRLVLVEDKRKNIVTNHNVIFAVNHTNVHDVPAASMIIKEHCYIVAGGEVKNDINGLMFRLNGVTFLNRTNSNERKTSKENLLKYLMHGENIMIFPESTWNRLGTRGTKERLMMPLWPGAVELSQKTGVPIVPVILEYMGEVCYAKIGEEIRVEPLENIEKAKVRLRDAMATLKWEILEEFAQDSRKNVSQDAFESAIQSYLDEYPKLNTAFEDSVIFKEKDIVDSEEVFEPIYNLTPTCKNAFLFKKI